MKTQCLPALSAALMLLLHAAPSNGFVSRQGYIADASGRNTIDVTDFDFNRDGIIATDEVADMLFKLYDRDGNAQLDQIESERPITVTVNKGRLDEERLAYNFNGVIVPPGTPHAYEDFLRYSGLSRYTSSAGGISARDLLGRPLPGTTGPDAWHRLYAASLGAYSNTEARL